VLTGSKCRLGWNNKEGRLSNRPGGLETAAPCLVCNHKPFPNPKRFTFFLTQTFQPIARQSFDLSVEFFDKIACLLSRLAGNLEQRALPTWSFDYRQAVPST